jgi:hypothetical protein
MHEMLVLVGLGVLVGITAAYVGLLMWLEHRNRRRK